MFPISFDRFTLPNGLEVVLHQDRSLPIAAVNVWYHVGSKDEEVGRTGFAHLFEHVMFEGSKHHNRDYFEPLQKVGASVNGSTTSDRTNYWENVPSNYLELALWLESDRMGFLLDALDQKRFDIQRDVVKNERRQSYENRPYGLAQLLLQPVLWPSPHPYSWPVIGSQEDLDAASLEDVKAFFRRFYAPSNATLTIAGDFDDAKARRMIERYFGDIPPAPPVNRLGRMDSSLKGEVRLNLRDSVQLPRLYLVWPSCSMFDDREAPLDILASVLGDDKTSRLYKSLVYEKQIARDVSVGNFSQEIAGEFQIEVTASPGHSLDEILEEVEAELERIRGAPPDDQEITRTMNRIESERVHRLERFGGFGGRADMLSHYTVFAGDPGVINSDIERYRAVTGEDVARAARSVFGSDRVRLTVVPERVSRPSRSSVDRSVMPKESKHREFTPPVPQRISLSNGLDILYVARSGLPIVSLGLLIRAGATTDPTERPGVAQMTATMLQEGTTTRSSQEIAEEMALLGTQLDSHTGREYVMLSADTLSSHWSRALEIIADVARNPSFPKREVERVRKERLADLRRIGDYPMSVALRASHALVYGPETRYGHPVSGTEASVKAMTRKALVGHYQTHYGPQRATLIVAGDLSHDDLVSNVEASLGSWSHDTLQAEVSADVDGTPSAETSIFIADKPGAAQSIIRAGHLTIPRHHPDYYAMSLANYVFGGNPSARLFMNLRQDKGYSYGFYSSIDWLSGPSSIFAGGAVETSVTKESVVETLKEFADIRGERPVTLDEFNSAKAAIIRGLPSQFETQGQLLHQLSRVVIFNLPDDYYSHFLSNLDAVTVEDVRRVAAERIDDGHLVLLVVGDRQVVEPGLQGLGLPTVQVDHEGHRVR
jgi:zinc protease